MTKTWHSIDCLIGHRGAGRETPSRIYLMAENASDALQKYMELPAFKSNRYKHIKPLTQEESEKLESEISSKGMPLKEVRDKGYFPEK